MLQGYRLRITTLIGVATAGFRANRLPGNLGAADAPRRGWLPLR